MKIMFVVLTLLLISTIQVAFLDLIKVFGCRPDLILIAVVFFALRAGWQRGMLIGLLAGFIADMLTVGRLGLFSTSFCLCGMLLGLFTNKLYFENPFTQSLLVFLVTYLNALIYFTLSHFFYGLSLWGLYAKKIVPQSFYNLVIAFVLFVILWKFERKRLFSI